MEIILEVQHPNGSRTWHRLGPEPLTLGRAFSNDVILDDPYADARHVRVRQADSGLTLEDFGSVNGVVVNAERRHGAFVLEPGMEVRVGRTVLRVHEPNEVVPAALLDEPAAIPSAVPTSVHTATSQTVPVRPQMITGRPAPRLIATALVLTAAAGFGVNLWLGSAERSSASSAVSTTAGFLVLAVAWAAIWAAIGRVVIHRFSLASHLAVISAAFLVALAVVTVQDWLNFLFPDSTAVTTFAAIVNFSLGCALIAWHLRFSSGLAPRHRWRFGIIGAAAVVGVGVLSSLTDKETFSDVPVFSSAIKPVAANWVPTNTLDEFSQVSRSLKQQVDEMSLSKK